jgi:ion channel-forming bestrophin family protein
MIQYDRGHWLSMVFRIHGSVVRYVWPRVLATTAAATVFVFLQEDYPALRRSLTMAPFLITALPLGIILGFRNSSSYERFWEGRRLWGSLVNASRSLLRQVESLVIARKAEDRERVETFRREMGHRLIATAHALRLHLRDETKLDELAPWLEKDEIAALAREPSPPAALLHRMGRELGAAYEREWLESRHVPLLEGTLVVLTDVVGGCERIKQTPTPISYLIFIHRAVALYCFLLPLGVSETVKHLTPVVVFFVSYALFSLDAIGDELDDPFRASPNGLPLASIARKIEIYARVRLGDTDIPEPTKPVDGVLS